MRVRDRLRPFVPYPLLNAKRRVKTEVDLWRSVGRLKGVGRAQTGNEALHMSLRYRGCGEFEAIKALQDEEEISRLLDLLIAERVRTVAEIGSYLGGTLFMMTRILPDDAALVSIDWPGSERELPYPASRKRFHEGFGRANQTVSVVYGDSRDQATVRTLRGILGERELDFLFIDGDHSLVGVESDFQVYSPFVRPGGLIALHDIVPHPQFGVATYWERLKQTYKTEEIVSPARRQAEEGYGFGVVRWEGVKSLAV